jgi:4-amino-4-deoxy-L-arabinose transferase-like glycosyltransferase
MRCRSGFLVALALALHWVMAVSVSPHVGVTADEVVHVTGGYSYWKFDDYRLHPENGTLPMRLAALPLLAMPLTFPSLHDPDWLTSKVDRVGQTFFWQLGNPVDAMLRRARMMIALTSVFAIWLTWRWARGLFGPAAGWMALGLAVFSPSMLAHAGLATSDMTLVACMLAALSLFWRLLHRVTWTGLVLTILAAGATFLAKMSGVLLVPVVALLVVARWRRRAPLVIDLGRVPRWIRRRTAIAAITLGVAGVVGAGSLVVLWAGYDFRYAAANRERSDFQELYFSWDTILEREKMPPPPPSALASLVAPVPPPRPTAMTRLVGVIREHRLLPEAYLWGLAHTYKFSRERPAFLCGAFSRTGWPWFFPVAFLLKTTLPVLVLFLSGTVVLARRVAAEPRMRRRAYRAAPLVIFSVLYGGLAITSHLNIGHRHILPLYPAVFIVASAAAAWLVRRVPRRAGWVLGTLVALHAADSLAARPFYLSYFQPLTGGSDRGYRYLVDSSSDWGQGLPDFAAWESALRARGDREPVYLSYFGADSPRGRGLDVVRFGDSINDHGPRVYPAQVHGGWFAISATHFQRIYLPVRGPWTESHERLYRRIMGRLGDAANASASDDASTARLLRDAEGYEVLQFGRLCHFLRDRRPDRVIGGSILLFHLTDRDVRFALYAPWPDFQPYLR